MPENEGTMLKNTVVLSKDDDSNAGELKKVIDLRQVVVMLILDAGGAEEQIVKWADQDADKLADGRRVVWLQSPEGPKVKAILDTFLGQGNRPFIAVLNYNDLLKKTLTKEDKIDEIALEDAFLAGEAK